MKQMKITVYKDESLNVLRGFQSLKIASIKSDNFKNKLQDHYDNQNNNEHIANIKCNFTHITVKMALQMF